MDDPANCCLTVMDVIRAGPGISNSSLAAAGAGLPAPAPVAPARSKVRLQRPGFGSPCCPAFPIFPRRRPEQLPPHGEARCRSKALGLDGQFGSIIMLMTITIRGATA